MTGVYICPIYDKEKDFEYGYKLVESAVKCGTSEDLYFVFSDQAQQDKFMDHCMKRFDKKPGKILYDDPLKDCRNPVSMKKWYGIRALSDQYDYIAAIDCECIFLKAQQTGKILDEIWNTQSFLRCNKSTVGASDVKKCAEALGLDQDERLIRETQGFTLTWWFNEIPVYKASDLNAFFEWLDEPDRYKTVYHEWCCFDYYVYVIWLILYRDMHLRALPYTNIAGTIEGLWGSLSFNKAGIEKCFNTHWTSRNERLENNERLCIQFHTDRRFTGNRFVRFLKKVKRMVLSIGRQIK